MWRMDFECGRIKLVIREVENMGKLGLYKVERRISEIG